MKIRLIILTNLFFSFTLLSQERLELYYLNGQIKKEGELSAGLPSGKWSEYREDGSLEKESIYRNRGLTEEIWYDTRRVKQRAITHKEDGTTLYRQFTRNGMLRAMSDVNPELLADSLALAKLDRGFVLNLCNDQGSFVSNAYKHPHGYSRAFPFHEFHSRTRLKTVTCGTNSVTWHRYSGPATAEGYFDTSEDFLLLEWPERGFPDDPFVRSFDKTKLESKLKCYFINGLPYGNWTNYYPNGQLWYAISYKDGLPDGTVQSFYHTGQAMLEARFVSGRLDGTCSEWYAHGQKRYAGEYTLGTRIGTWTYWSAEGKETEVLEFDTKGALTSHEIYHDNGMLKSRENHCLQSDCQSWTEWNEAGQLIKRDAFGQMEIYSQTGLPMVHSSMISPAINYHPNGSVARIDGLRNGVGLVMEYQADGSPAQAVYSYSPEEKLTYVYTDDKVQEESSVSATRNTKTISSIFKNQKKMGLDINAQTESGLRQGKYILSYPGGKKWFEAVYEKGLLQGGASLFSIDGQLIQKGQYDKGLPIGQHVLYSSSGQKLKEEQYSKGYRDGPSIEMNEQGNTLLEQHFVMGVLSGDVKRFDANGTRIAHERYQDGQLHGKKTLFYPDGKEAGYQTYEMGLLSGPAKSMNGAGESAQGAYVNGQRHGRWTYTADGRTETVQFVQGREFIEPDPQQCIYSLDNPLITDLQGGQSITSVVNFQDLSSWTSERLTLDESTFAGLVDQSPATRDAEAPYDIIATSPVKLDSPDFPGFTFDLTPMQHRGEYSTIPITIKKVDYFLRDFARFDEGFEGKTKDYFHLGLDQYNMDEVSMMSMTRDFLMDERALDSESSFDLIYEQFISDALIDTVPAGRNNQLLSDQLMANGEACRESLLRLAFGHDGEKAPSEEDISRLNLFFAPLSGEEFKANVDRKIGQFTADARPTSFAMEMPPGMISANRGEQHTGARLMMDINLLRFNTQTGLSIISASDFCFAEGYVGGSPFTVDIDQPEVVMRKRKLRELIPNTQDYYFYAENLGLDFSGVFAAEAMGRYFCENGDELFLEYANIGITDKFFAGRLTVNIPDEHRHEIFKKLEEAFTYHEIISEWGTVLEIYFMRLKPKAP